MLSDKMLTALNKQVNAEFFASYLYLSMVADFESKNLPGFAAWLRAQVQEELTHAMKIYNHIVERGGRVTLLPVDGPPTEWETPLAAFEAAYGHECKVTGMINDLVDMATQEKDHASVNFLQWFVAEQVEEEASADGVVQKLKLVSDGSALFVLDKEMGARAFTIPADM